ncbi:hypothetical protein ZWY2020_007121 [Hordeum vulgare]|nr:hypothetical protein ZWY2020_007121 [Hordeum vulgare]
MPAAPRSTHRPVHGSPRSLPSPAANGDRAIGREARPQPPHHEFAAAQPPHLGRVDGATREILLRIPPDDPASLVRASAVRTTWLEIILDPAFFHGASPVLGNLHKKSYESHGVAPFDPTGASCPLVRDRRNWHAADSRHGRVLFYTPREKHADFIVWDPITDRQWGVSTDPKLSEIIETADDQQEEITWVAAVLCGKDGCDHLGCHAGPFLVAFAGSNEIQSTTFACVYCVIFLNTEAGLFAVEVRSGQTKKLHRKMFVQTGIPYASFYSREHVRIVMPLQSKRGRGDHPHESETVLPGISNHTHHAYHDTCFT